MEAWGTFYRAMVVVVGDGELGGKSGRVIAVVTRSFGVKARFAE